MGNTFASFADPGRGHSRSRTASIEAQVYNATLSQWEKSVVQVAAKRSTIKYGAAGAVCY